MVEKKGTERDRTRNCDNRKQHSTKQGEKSKRKRISLYFLTSKYRTKGLRRRWRRRRRCVPLFEIPDVVVVRKKETKKHGHTHTHIGE
jgi:hypothetical protein